MMNQLQGIDHDLLVGKPIVKEKKQLTGIKTVNIIVELET